MTGKQRKPDALAVARELGVKMASIEEVYKGIKPYEPLDDTHLSLREFAELTGIKYKNLLRTVRKLAPVSRWDLLPAPIALHVTIYGAQFEACKGRGVEKVEFRVSIGANDRELRDRVDCIIAKRHRKPRWTQIRVSDSNKAALDNLAAITNMSVPKVLDLVLEPYSKGIAKVAERDEGTVTGITQ